jgi:hypothetical protein
LVRATTAASGNSANVAVNNKSHLVQQSIGQASVAGTFYDSDYICVKVLYSPMCWQKIRCIDSIKSAGNCLSKSFYREYYDILFRATSEIEVVVLI